MNLTKPIVSNMCVVEPFLESYFIKSIIEISNKILFYCIFLCSIHDTTFLYPRKVHPALFYILRQNLSFDINEFENYQSKSWTLK